MRRVQLVAVLAMVGGAVGCGRGVGSPASVATVASGDLAPAATVVPTDMASFATIAKAVTPAVVAIESVLGPDTTSGGEEEMRPSPGENGGGENAPRRALGSGFLVTSDGLILTNNHVVADSRTLTVGLSDRRIFKAKIIGRDPSTDVALIKIEGADLPTLPLGDDSTVQVGDPVLAVGDPLGLDFTVTSGLISAKGRRGSLRGLFASAYAVVDFLQTDAVINPGNSGGPLVDMHGRAIGINTAIASPTGVYAGYGFAVPISIARIVMDELQKYGRVRHPILGIAVQDVGPADAEAAGLHEIRGALVGGLTGPTSPAAKAGLAAGDVILAVDGHPVNRVSDLQRVIFGYQPGTTITIDATRFGARRTVKLTLGEPPDQTQLAGAGAASGTGTASAHLGIGVAPLTPDLAGQLQLPAGATGLAVVRVDPTGPAARQLAPGDVITAVLGPGTQHPVHSIDDLHYAVDHASNGVVSLLVFSPQSNGSHVVNIALVR
jgi:serine protease Do